MTNRLDNLERLARLRASGALTDQEFEQQKARVLGQPTGAPTHQTASPSDRDASSESSISDHLDAPRSRRWLLLGIIAVIVIALVAGMWLYQRRDQRSEGGRDGLQAAGTSPGACQQGQVLLVADTINASGTLELLAPVSDTDAYNEMAHDLRTGPCISRSKLEELVRNSGAAAGEAVNLAVAYDPRGTLENFRPRLDMEADPGEPDVKPAPPPADMKFGEAAWRPSSNQLSVTWYSRSHEWFSQFESSRTNSPAGAPAASEEPPSCNAEILRTVRAEQDSEATMDQGETWPNVTQYWKNKSTGRGRFCAHGDYCYPADAIVDGKSVPTIKLLNCSVREQVSSDDEGILFGVW